MKVRKATLLGISLVAAASCCTAFSPAQGPQAPKQQQQQMMMMMEYHSHQTKLSVMGHDFQNE